MSAPPLSRRETLKRAAGALALGLGAPAALASDSDDVVLDQIKIEWYRSRDDEPIASISLPRQILPREVAEVLMEPEAFTYVKYTAPESKRWLGYEARLRDVGDGSDDRDRR